MKLEIRPKKHFGFRVINLDGEAELGNWHIADFAWEEHAKFFVAMMQSVPKSKEGE